MTIFLALIIICLLSSMRFTKEFNINYLSKDNTNVIKGFFLLLVFLSHICGYYKFNANFDSHYFLVRSIMGQTVVVTFLFFSGYGVMESISNKSNYMFGFLKNRVLKLLLHFDIAVTLFLITQVILGRHISIKQYLLALTTWGGIGNSNWYITCILCCYLFSYLCVRLGKQQLDKVVFLVLMFSLCLNYMLLLSKYRPAYCYDTILCYPLGMMFSVYKDKIVSFLKDSQHYMMLFGGAIVIAIATYILSKTIVYRVIYELAFCLIVILLMMHFNFKNKFLEYVGINLFGLYILQRIPMLYFKQLSAFSNKYIYVIVCFLATLILNELFKRLLKILRL